MRRITARFTYANVTSTVALMLVLTGGTAYAASKLIDGRSIVTGTVGSKQLRNGDVQTADLSRAARIALAGEDGGKGDTGPQGAPGAAGAPGTAGAQGERGVTGAPGTQGAKGAKGDTGDQGPAGSQGSSGIPGAQGEPGIAGTPGAAGAAGYSASGGGFATYPPSTVQIANGSRVAVVTGDAITITRASKALATFTLTFAYTGGVASQVTCELKAEGYGSMSAAHIESIPAGAEYVTLTMTGISSTIPPVAGPTPDRTVSVQPYCDTNTDNLFLLRKSASIWAVDS